VRKNNNKLLLICCQEFLLRAIQIFFAMSSKSTCILDDYIITDKVIGNCEHGRMLIILSRKDRNPYALKPYKQTLESKREIEIHQHACKISRHVVKIYSVYNDFGLYKVPYYLVVQEL
jgi:hypothetical protein